MQSVRATIMKIFAIFFTVLGVCVIWYSLTKPLAVRFALPISSVVTMDESYQDYPNGDYLHCVSTEVTDSEFKKFSEKMGLRKGEGLIDRIPSCAVDWWVRELSLKDLYGNRDNTNESSYFSVYSNGRVYFVSYSS